MLRHLLCACPVTAALRARHGIPTFPTYLHVYLLGLSGTEMGVLVSDLEALRASSRSFCGLLPPVLVPHPLVAPGSWVVYWDGSY